MGAMKKCFKCGKNKRLSSFYAHPQSADGHLGKCKECTRKDVRDNRAKRLAYYQEYDRQRTDDPDRKAARAEYARKQAATVSGRKRTQARQRAWLANNEDKRAAHVIAGNAIRDGRLIPDDCARCGASPSQAHHEDYGKPLEVTWLCRTCHGLRHREINAERRKK